MQLSSVFTVLRCISMLKVAVLASNIYRLYVIFTGAPAN